MGDKNKKLIIFTEGKSDVNFLRYYLLYILVDFEYEIDVINDDCTLAELLYKNFQINIQSTGGYTKITKLIQFFKMHNASKEPVLVIQDADSKEKNHGTYHERMKYFSNIKKQKDIQFETFLFPNNQNDGDLETLLMKIVIGKNYDKYFKCYQSYQECIKPFIPEAKSEKNRGDKDILFNYCYNVLDDQTPSENKRKYDVDEWDFEHKDLNILKGVVLKMVEKLISVEVEKL